MNPSWPRFFLGLAYAQKETLAEQPRLDPIRSDSGFAALLARVGHTASAPNAD